MASPGQVAGNRYSRNADGSVRGLKVQGKAATGAACALLLVAVQFGAIRFSPSDTLVRIALPLTIATVPLVLWPYRDRIGVWVMFVGMAANLAPIVANGGLMPVQQATVIEAIGAARASEYETGTWIAGSKDVLVGPGEGRLVGLGDQIIVRIGGGGMIVSPGDMVVWAGLLILAAEASTAWQRRARVRARGVPVQAAEEGAAT